VVIADYQVLTDRETFDTISDNTIQLAIDYLAVGLDPINRDTKIFTHSQIPELNQLLLPFLTLVTMSELDRNPTVKEEIQAAGLKKVNAGMYTYPVHQAADILFCKGNLVPVGKDQLPHLEMTRVIARRFNERYSNKGDIFPEPQALLSTSSVILGLDGSQKMSKSRNNAVMISSSEDETAQSIKKAKTDSLRLITYDPATRPEVANLLQLISLSTGLRPELVAEQIGEGGSGKLKSVLTESLNEYLRPIRARRKELEGNLDHVKSILRSGIDDARLVAIDTLNEVREAMNMKI